MALTRSSGNQLTITCSIWELARNYGQYPGNMGSQELQAISGNYGYYLRVMGIRQELQAVSGNYENGARIYWQYLGIIGSIWELKELWEFKLANNWRQLFACNCVTVSSGNNAGVRHFFLTVLKLHVHSYIIILINVVIM